MVLCGTWSETSVAQSQLTQFWQIPRHRTLSYSLWTPFFVTITPSGGTWKCAKAPSTKKKTWRDSLPIDMLLSEVSVLVVAQSSSEFPEGLMNNPVFSRDNYIWRQMSVKRIRLFIRVKRNINNNIGHWAHSTLSPHPHSLLVTLPEIATPPISQTPHLKTEPQPHWNMKQNGA